MMIALEFHSIFSKSCMRIFPVNDMLRSSIPLMLETKDTILDTLFSVRILFSMIAVEFGCISSKSSMKLFWVNVM